MTADKHPTSYGSAVADKVAALVAPMAEALGLEIYDIDYSGGTLKVVLDTPPGQPGGVSLDDLALVTRQLGRELDHSDPVPGRYTLEVTSPGLERALRRPQHFMREVGKTVNIRLHSAVNGMRRIQGTLVSANAEVVTIGDIDGAGSDKASTLDVHIADIERARTVFEWERAEKPGKAGAKKSAARNKSTKSAENSEETHTEATAS